jgi:hypothetical protein
MPKLRLDQVGQGIILFLGKEENKEVENIR